MRSSEYQGASASARQRSGLLAMKSSASAWLLVFIRSAIKLGGERRLALEAVQRDGLDKLGDRDIKMLGNALEDLQQSFLDAEAGLHAFDLFHGNRLGKWYQGVKGQSFRDAADPPYSHACRPCRSRHGSALLDV
jgi:hypothetical protein